MYTIARFIAAGLAAIGAFSLLAILDAEFQTAPHAATDAYQWYVYGVCALMGTISFIVYNMTGEKRG